MRYFLVDRLYPAVEVSPGVMMSLTDDGSWAPISSDEVLADERSPEVSEDRFAAEVDAMGDRKSVV